ncbi:MAG: thiamine biosynthesis protein [Parachlamydia sp.]|nr:MAG: thiamine biosynthesis protein [Parachlamydia sp.]
MKRLSWRFFLILFLFSCQKSPQTTLYEFTGNAMTMNYRILIGHPLSLTEKNFVLEAISQVFDEVNRTYNKWNPHSELSHLNRQPAGKRILLSPSLENFLTETGCIVHLSEGKFDPTIETIQQIWRQAFAKGELPAQEELASGRAATGWESIHYAEHYFWKDKDQTQLDLGGIAKGLAVDLLVEKLNTRFENVYVEWGGEIRTSGQHPDQRPWKIFVSGFGSCDPAKALATIEIHNQAIATSGDYLQNWTIGQTTYSHIIDPQTGKPLISLPNRISSASVRASTCARADGLATAAMLFEDLPSAQAWAQRMEKFDPSLTFWLIAQDGSTYATVSTMFQ